MSTGRVSRREFLGGTLAATAGGTALLGALKARAEEAPAAERAPPPIGRRIKLGVVGLGGRGHWIARLFRDHGGYEIHAVADYFPEVAESAGRDLGVDPARCFSRLSGYRRLIDSGIEAIALEDIPCFYPEQAAAAVAAGLHVYMAKPVAVDVPGAMSVLESGRAATAKQRGFFVDYQMPTDPHNQEAARRVAAGALGPLQAVFSVGYNGGMEAFPDPPLSEGLERRLRHLIWVNDNELGAGHIGNYDIHIVDALLWALQRKPVSACGWGERFRRNPQGKALDSVGVLFTFEDGLVWNHQSMKGMCDDWFSSQGSLAGIIQGRDANARLSYWGQAYVRGGGQPYRGGNVSNLYEEGAKRNIETFYRNVVEGRFENPTLQRSVDGLLTCILGREAAEHPGRPVTMEQILKDNRKLEVDVSGLKA
jgi:myo-inositol 2-dehydrogenase / D-chiro-inositol 1-dehydrogenase